MSQNFNFRERRRQADWVVRGATVLSAVSWLIALAVMIILDQAAPERENFFTRLFEENVRLHWDAQLLFPAFILLILSLATCIAAFIFNSFRMRRKTDKYRASIFIIGAVNIAGIVYFLVRFGSVMF